MWSPSNWTLNPHNFLLYLHLLSGTLSFEMTQGPLFFRVQILPHHLQLFFRSIVLWISDSGSVLLQIYGTRVEQGICEWFEGWTGSCTIFIRVKATDCDLTSRFQSRKSCAQESSFCIVCDSGNRTVLSRFFSVELNIVPRIFEFCLRRKAEQDDTE